MHNNQHNLGDIRDLCDHWMSMREAVHFDDEQDIGMSFENQEVVGFGKVG